MEACSGDDDMALIEERGSDPRHRERYYLNGIDNFIDDLRLAAIELSKTNAAAVRD